MGERERPFLDPFYWRKAADADPVLRRAFEISLESFLMAHIAKHFADPAERESRQSAVAEAESLDNLEAIARSYGILEEFLARDAARNLYLDWQSNPDWRNI